MSDATAPASVQRLAELTACVARLEQLPTMAQLTEIARLVRLQLALSAALVTELEQLRERFARIKGSE